MNEQNPNQQSSSAEFSSEPRRLYRSVGDRKLAGVCGGVAEFFGIDTVMVRVLWVLSCFFGLFGVLAYIVAWAIIPDNPYGVSAPRRPPSGSGRYVWGTLLIVLGVVWLAERHHFYFLVPWRWDDFFVPHWMSWGVIFSALLIVLGLFLVLRGTDAARRAPHVTGLADTSTPLESFQGEHKMNTKRLTRSFKDRMIGGVCGGMAEYFNIDPSLVRVGWVLLTFFSGFFFGIIAYIVLMVVVPEERPHLDQPGTTTPTPAP